MSHRSRKQGFTLVELLVVIGIIAVLISILLPALNKARDAARTSMCLSNQRQIALGFSMYTNDSKGYLPPGYVGTTATTPNSAVIRENWASILAFGKYIKVPKVRPDYGNTYNVNDPAGDYPSVLRCPNGLPLLGSSSAGNEPVNHKDGRGGKFSRRFSNLLNDDMDLWYATYTAFGGFKFHIPMREYKYVRAGGPLEPGYAGCKITTVKRSSEVPLVFDGFGFVSENGKVIHARHAKQQLTNIMFADGHCESVRSDSIPDTTLSLAVLQNFPRPKWRLDQP